MDMQDFFRRDSTPSLPGDSKNRKKSQYAKISCPMSNQSIRNGGTSLLTDNFCQCDVVIGVFFIIIIYKQRNVGPILPSLVVFCGCLGVVAWYEFQNTREKTPFTKRNNYGSHNTQRLTRMLTLMILNFQSLLPSRCKYRGPLRVKVRRFDRDLPSRDGNQHELSISAISRGT